jgi:hypothetical protein
MYGKVKFLNWVEFIFETKSINILQALSSINSKRKKAHQNWLKIKNLIYLLNIKNFKIWVPKIAMSWCIKMIISKTNKKCIKIE